jgi:hypothetical protein
MGQHLTQGPNPLLHDLRSLNPEILRCNMPFA